MPRPLTWCSWLNGIGWARVMPMLVTYEERATTESPHPRPARMNTAPKIVTREIVLKLRWKICGTTSPPVDREPPTAHRYRRAAACGVGTSGSGGGDWTGGGGVPIGSSGMPPGRGGTSSGLGGGSGRSGGRGGRIGSGMAHTPSGRWPLRRPGNVAAGRASARDRPAGVEPLAALFGRLRRVRGGAGLRVRVVGRQLALRLFMVLRH